jgi:hypothetical protein
MALAAFRNAEMRIPLESTQIICAVESAERRDFVKSRGGLSTTCSRESGDIVHVESGKFACKTVKESRGLHLHHSCESGTVAMRLTLRPPAGCRL